MKSSFTRVLVLMLLAFAFFGLQSVGVAFDTDSERISYWVGMLVEVIVFSLVVELIIKIMLLLFRIIGVKDDDNE